MDYFKRGHLRFESGKHTPEDTMLFWRYFDVPEAVLAIFVEVDPRWESGAKELQVRAELEFGERCWEKVSMVILVCRLWAIWSETRWARFGGSGRLFVRSLLTRVDAAVEMCFAHERVVATTYNMSGYRRASSDVRLLLGIAAFAVQPFEDYILQMLEDDRLLRRAGDLHARLLQKMSVVIAMPDLVWNRVAGIVNIPMGEYRKQVISAMCPRSLQVVAPRAFLHVTRRSCRQCGGPRFQGPCMCGRQDETNANSARRRLTSRGAHRRS